MPYKDPDKRKAVTKAWRCANPKKVKSYAKLWRENNQEKIKAISKAYCESNQEKRKKANKLWRENNQEKVKTIGKAWRENNQEKIKAYNHHPLNAASDSITRLTGLKKSEIPTDLLEAQALIISINREIRNNEKLHRA